MHPAHAARKQAVWCRLLVQRCKQGLLCGLGAGLLCRHLLGGLALGLPQRLAHGAQLG